MNVMETPVVPPAPRRRWRPAALLAVGIATVAGTALITWQMLDQRAARRAAALSAFDLDAAMELAGSVVPPDIESFYFFVLDPDRPAESDELAAKLMRAASEREILGITGPDAEHNRAVLRAALALTATHSLAGLVVVYVGPAEHEHELNGWVRATGAECRYVIYAPGAHETI